MIENLLTTVDNVNIANANPNTKHFHLVWISDHSSVQGNEKVDEEAKKSSPR